MYEDDISLDNITIILFATVDNLRKEWMEMRKPTDASSIASIIKEAKSLYENKEAVLVAVLSGRDLDRDDVIYTISDTDSLTEEVAEWELLESDNRNDYTYIHTARIDHPFS